MPQNLKKQDAAAAPSSLWAVWSVLAAVPWLVPTHVDPWPTFYPEASCALVLGAAALVLALRERGTWPLGLLAAAAFALAAVPALQAASGLFVFPREAALIGLCLAGFAGAVLLGRKAAHGPLLDALFASFAIAALLSAGLAIYQWLGLDALGLLVAPSVRGGRPAANVGQPNNLATLLVWGLIGFWWAWAKGRLGGRLCVAAAVLLLAGLALTESRTGWLAVALLTAAAVAGRRSLLPRHGAAVALGLALVFVAFVALLAPASDLLLRDTPRPLEQQFAAGKRPLIWRLALAAIAERPWTGWGWNQGVRAHVELAPRFEGLNVAVGHAHNLVLDLLVWNGVLLGSVVVAGLAWWCWRRVREARTAPQQLVLLALAAPGLHAMLELPHVYAFFFLPAGVLMGAAEGLSPAARAWPLPRAAALALAAALTGLVGLAWHEYGRIEDNVASHRLREANIGLRAPPPAPQVLLLQPLMQVLQDLRTEPRRGMTAEERARLHAAALRLPSLSAQFRDAEAAALNGDTKAAAWSLGRLCLMHTAAECVAAGRDWHALRAAGKPELDPALLPPAATAP